MTKRETSKVVGYILLLVSLLLLIGYACVYFSSFFRRTPEPPPRTPGTVSLKVADGIAYFEASGAVYALRTGDGKQLWRFQVDGIGDPVVAGGTVYVVDSDWIYALRGSDGKKLWQKTQPCGRSYVCLRW